MSTTLRGIRNGRVITPGGVVEGGVVIEDGKIVAVGSDRLVPDAGDVLDAKGGFIIPGVVDPEAHLGSNRPLDVDFATESRAAVAAGVTTWGLQLTTHTIYRSDESRPGPETELLFGDLVEPFIGIGENASSCDFFLTPLLMTLEQAEQIPELARRFGVTTFKLYMHMRLGRELLERAWPQAPLLGVRSFDDGLVYRAMQGVASLGERGLLSVHCENWEIARLRELDLRAEGRSDVAAWHDRSPGYLEAMHVRAYGYLAGVLGCRMHVQHVTAIETLAALEDLRRSGTRIYGQTGAHYLVLDAGAWKLNTPLRPAHHRDALWEATRSGVVNSIGSDHVCRGMPRSAMERDSVWDLVSGFSSRVEAHLPLLISEGVSAGRIDIGRLVELTATNPARLWGLFPRKGVIQPGSDADLVVIDPSKRLVLRPEHIQSAAGWSIYEGMEFRGWPVATVLRGQLAAEWSGDTCSISADLGGRYLPRSMSDEPGGLAAIA